MKTFAEIRNQRMDESVSEGYIRKGTGLVYARQSKQYGDQATKFFRSAVDKFNSTRSLSNEESQKNLTIGLADLSKGLEQMRNQNGAITSLLLSSVLLNQRT